MRQSTEKCFLGASTKPMWRHCYCFTLHCIPHACVAVLQDWYHLREYSKIPIKSNLLLHPVGRNNNGISNDNYLNNTNSKNCLTTQSLYSFVFSWLSGRLTIHHSFNQPTNSSAYQSSSIHPFTHPSIHPPIRSTNQLFYHYQFSRLTTSINESIHSSTQSYPFIKWINQSTTVPSNHHHTVLANNIHASSIEQPTILPSILPYLHSSIQLPA